MPGDGKSCCCLRDHLCSAELALTGPARGRRLVVGAVGDGVMSRGSRCDLPNRLAQCSHQLAWSRKPRAVGSISAEFSRQVRIGWKHVALAEIGTV